jgi:hypothetical protein
MKYIMITVVATLYCICMYSVRPSTHVPGLDGPTTTCKNPYHTHHK